MKYRRKPTLVDAVQITAADFNGRTWDGSPFKLENGEVPEWLGMALDNGDIKVHPDDRDYAMWAIQTLEGTMIAGPGDYIIRGIKGELYFCKPDIFELTYEPV